MQYNFLGKTNLKVSKLCFGGLTIGPLQANLPLDEGSEIVAYAFEKGINFIDTAQLYKTYDYIKLALKKSKKDVIIASKTYAYTKEQAVKAVEEARKKLDRDVIDIFLLHEQESINTLNGHKEALDTLLSYKAKGVISAVGASMHHISAVLAACEMNEIDVIHPIINKNGIGIADGSLNDMLLAVKKAYDKGIGIYSMKPLGGGNLLSQYKSSLNFVLDLPFVHSVAVGMQSQDEIDANINFFEKRELSPLIEEKLAKKQKKLHIEKWCTGCGKCLPSCSQNALFLENKKLIVKKENCILCGYCGAKCENFAIKII